MIADAVPRRGLLARNSFANLVRVGSTSLVSLLLPLVLITVLEPRFYATWALLFGLAGFVLYLDFGLPTSVQTLVARAGAADDPAGRRRVAISGIRWAVGIGLALLALIAVVGARATFLFPALGTSSVGLVAGTLVLIAIGNVSTLVGNTASAFFAALQRSSVAAVTLVPGRVGSLIVSVLLAVATQNVALVATGYAVPLVLGAVAMILRVMLGSGPTGRPGRTSSAVRFEVVRYSGPLTAWSLYMLCISGAGIVIVGRVDYRSIAAFSLATAFSAALTGVQSAVIAPILSELGRSYAAGDQERSTRIVLTASAANGAIIGIGVVGIQALYLAFQPFLGHGASGSTSAAAVIGLTVLAGGIRLTMSPLTFAFIGSGSHGRLLLPPMCEAVVTLGATIALGVLLGALGVAVGLVIGAISGVLLALLWSHRITRVVAASGRTIALHSAVKPLLAIIMAEAIFFGINAGGSNEVVRLLGAVVMVVVSGVLLWTWSVPRSLRGMLLDAAPGFGARAGERRP